MRLCLDEHYSIRIAEQLRERGHDVISVKENAALIGISDEELLTFAAREGRGLLTEDVIDFVPLINALGIAGERHYGIVFTSPRTMPRSRDTIGTYVAAVDGLLQRFPGEDDFIDHVEWLRPT